METAPSFTSPKHVSRDAWEAELLSRIRQAADNLSFARLSELTGVHPETVRRYVTKGRPSAYFIASLSSALDLSTEWMLLGITERRSKAHRSAMEIKPGSRKAAARG